MSSSVKAQLTDSYSKCLDCRCSKCIASHSEASVTESPRERTVSDKEISSQSFARTLMLWG